MDEKVVNTRLMIGGSVDGQRYPTGTHSPRDIVVPLLCELPPAGAASTFTNEPVAGIGNQTYTIRLIRASGVRVTLYALAGMSDADVMLALIEGYKPK